MRFFFRFILFILLLTQQTAWAEEVALKVGGHGIHVEIADTPESRARGLMYRESLPADQGMLFIFAEAGKHSFWTTNTPLPLSIAFIDASGVIVDIAEMRPQSRDRHSAQGEVLHALEMNRGWFASHGVKPGSTVQGLELAPQGR